MSFAKLKERNHIAGLILIVLFLMCLGCETLPMETTLPVETEAFELNLQQYRGAPALKQLIDNAIRLPDDPDDALYDPDDSEFHYPIWIVDVRSAGQYNRGYIPEAKNFPFNMMTGEIDTDGLPKDIYLIMYCETGGRARMAANALKEKGYTQYMVWGGVTDWPYGFVRD